MPLSKHNQLPDTLARTSVYIDILPESSSRWSSSSSHLHGLYRSPQGVIVFRPSSNTPRRMRDIDHTVTFVSTSVVIAKSSYIILLDGAPIHNEDTKLDCIGPYFTGSANPSDEGPLLYSTALVPKYWEFLCKSPDPTVYTILHDVYRPADPNPCLPRRLGRPHPVLIFSATYHFRYLVPAYMPLSSVTPSRPDQANAPFMANAADYDLPEPICPQKHSMHLSLSDDDSESLRSHEGSSQNLLNEQFIPDVGLDDNDLMINIHYSPEITSKGMIPQSSVSSLPKDIRNYIM
ncbi:hypothetical protein DFJ58DRAFT_677637 [Suillus subalutaceus]|uniref:uncharacterized protein n=1 Tax=Suillus subalutaceus TaxID=48586 RepID=UPI001B880960|nr:uncharacterized protein DFJ58DRAFT_677637 [Suillus subalutaceus]KAG1871271.1 hypothetical protein DFJ58DRAFT_677637 [Suillus subalutaceus]